MIKKKKSTGCSVVTEIGFRHQPTWIRILPILCIGHCDPSPATVTLLNLFPPKRTHNFGTYSLGSPRSKGGDTLELLSREFRI